MRVPRLSSSVIVRSQRLHPFGVTMAAAIVTRVHSENVVDVTVFPPMGTPQVYSAVVFDAESTNAEAWHWPEDETQALAGFIPPQRLDEAAGVKNGNSRW